MVLSNCKIDALAVYPVYKKPFDVIFKLVQTKEWLAQVDDFRTFLGNFVAAATQIGLPAQLRL
jgi:hypothetical protein